MPKVDYNRDTYNMCLCGGCPVNGSSKCVGEKEKGLEPMKEQIEKQNVMPDPKEMPGMYCSAGKTGCDDVDGDKSCLCPACAVLIEEVLQNSYYCLKGSAEEVG